MWTDLQRWPAFIDGFGAVVRVDRDWSAVGTELLWRSRPGGRGEVTERVEALEPDRVATHVVDEALSGTQTVAARAEEGTTRIELELDYELAGGGVLSPVTDFVFIRRAVRDSLRRTLRAFAAETEEII